MADAFAVLKRGAAEAEGLDEALERPARQWKTRARNDRLGVLSRKQQRIGKWIRPSAWMAAPLDLSDDILSVIVEALMRDSSVRAIKAFALVNRACAAAVSGTLQAHRVELRKRAKRLEVAEENTSKRGRRRARQRGYGDEQPPSSSESSSDEDGGESDATNDAYDARVDFLKYTKSIGIQKLRGNLLSTAPGRVWFHDNKSLLGHLQGGCELCDNVYGVALLPRGAGPVALFACDRCRSKGCVDLTLEFGNDTTTCTLVARVDSRETDANNYARALLSKRQAHRKRMLSNRSAGVPPPNLGKRVHVIEFTDPLLLAYSVSKHAMSIAPWPLELWHQLPPGLPQQLTFGGMLSLRGSDAVRDEARLHAMRRHKARSAGAKRRVALAQMLRSYVDARAAVGCVTRANSFEGWVQVIDICCAARSFEMRWLFKTDQAYHGFSDVRASQYKLLGMDANERDAAARRVETVARVLRISISRSLKRAYRLQENHTERDLVITLLKNLPKPCLEKPAEELEALVHMLCRVPVCLALRDDRTPHMLDVCFCLDGPFAGRQLKLSSYLYTSAVNRIYHELHEYQHMKGSKLSHVMVHKFVQIANGQPRWPGDPDMRRGGHNSARVVIFGLPMLWPSWLTAPPPTPAD